MNNCNCPECRAEQRLTDDLGVVESALCEKLRSTRRIREITGLSLPRIRRALLVLESMRRAHSGTLHYNTSGRGPLAHAPGWRKPAPP